MRERVLRIVTCILLVSLVFCTGCERFRESMERQRAEREEEEKYSFETEKDFLNFYRKEITNALRNRDKDALTGLFCENVTENTCDMDEGAEYLLGLEEWDDIGTLRSNCSSYKEYSNGGHSIFVMCWEDISVGDVKYRIYFSGYSKYYVEVRSTSKFSKENTGLTNLSILELDENNDPVEDLHINICGIYHPGRKACEDLFYTTLCIYSSTNDDGSYIDVMTDEALESIMTPELLKSADKDELEAFIKFIRYCSSSKRNDAFVFIGEKNGSFVLTTTITFELADRCFTLIVKDGLIDGASLSEDKDPVNISSGEIKGFYGLVD